MIKQNSYQELLEIKYKMVSTWKYVFRGNIVYGVFIDINNIKCLKNVNFLLFKKSIIQYICMIDATLVSVNIFYKWKNLYWSIYISHVMDMLLVDGLNNISETANFPDVFLFSTNFTCITYSFLTNKFCIYGKIKGCTFWIF